MAHNALYKRRRSSSFLPTTISPSLYLAESMPQPQPTSPRKRPHLEPRQPQESSKRQKRPNYPSASRIPPAFWDEASKLWLTKRTLKELDRRNTRPASSTHSSSKQFHRPLTRHTAAKWRNKMENWEPTLPAADFLTHCSIGRLEDIKLRARHGGPDLSDLRGYQKPVNPLQSMMSSSLGHRKRDSTASSNTKLTTNTATTRNTSPYDRQFEQHLVDHGIYTAGYKYPNGRKLAKPDNWDEIKERLARTRASLSPSKFTDTDFEDFQEANVDSRKEEQVTKYVIPIIEGKIADRKCGLGKIPFNNYEHLTTGTLVAGSPDLWYGARPEQINLQVRDKLSGTISPTSQGDLPVAPSFFLEVKGPGGSLEVAQRQATYDGALGARGIYSLRSYRQNEPVGDNNAYTITSTYHGGSLTMYTTHPARPDGTGSRPEYITTQIDQWGMNGSTEGFRRGATAFRNARDWTKEKRNEMIEQTNERANDASRTTPPAFSALVSSFTSEVSTVIAATSLSISAESPSQESPTTQIEAQSSETSADPPAKRSRSRYPQRHTSSQRNSIAAEC